LQKELARRINEKGAGTFASRHEILGTVTEEYHELEDAVMIKSISGLEDIKDELLDIAVACVFGVTCIDANTLEW
jgi:hypothetical protein